MNNEKKYVFLDIDGVMTSTRETPGSYMTNDMNAYGVSPGPLRRLMRLLDDTGADVIISSNWRKFDADGPGSVWRHPIYGNIKNPLPSFIKTLGTKFSGCLPAVRHVCKAQALSMWFSDHQNERFKYVIFDDDDREGYNESEFRENFIKTDYNVGLTDADCRKAKKILNI